jgi:biotin synthase
MIDAIVDKALDGEDQLDANEIAALYEVPLFSPDWGRIIAAGRQKAARACDGQAEVHAQVGLNLAPCPGNCLFCSFAACNGVFEEAVELPIEEVVRQAQRFEQDGANAIFFMATAKYPFDKFVDTCSEVRGQLKDDTVMVANFGDMSVEQAAKLKDIGFSGVYHALRLGEGRDTNFDPDARIETMHNVREAGLSLGTCVEPVGNEHTTEELVEKTIVTRDVEPCYSGAARRIPVPDTRLEQYGVTSEARMAQIIAVVRLALGYDIPGNCTHEPNVIGCAAGANLLWAETGSNPRDTAEKTEEARGMTVGQCREVLGEAEWDVLDGPSVFYTG